MLTISFVSECRKRGKRAWRLFGIVFEQIRAQKRAAPSCFGFTRANAGLVVTVLTTSFGKILIYQLFAAVKLKQREKNVVLVAWSPLQMLPMIKLKQWFFKTILHQNIKYLLNCNYQLCANLLSNFAFTNTFNSGWDLTIKCNHMTFIKLYCWLWIIGCN